MGRIKALHIADGAMKWISHCGKQCTCYSKIKL